MNCAQSLATEVDVVPRQQPSQTAAARLLVMVPWTKHAASPAAQGREGIDVALQLKRPLSSFKVQLRPAASFTKRVFGGSGSPPHETSQKLAVRNPSETTLPNRSMRASGNRRLERATSLEDTRS
jgi:hypothetical protein